MTADSLSGQEIIFEQAEFALGEKTVVRVGDLSLASDSLVVLIGGNGSGKSALARALSGKLPLIGGRVLGEPKAALVSLEQQMALLEDDYKLRNSDTTSPKEELGITAADLLDRGNPELFERVVAKLGLGTLLDTPIRLLSGGEGRKTLLAAALLSSPSLLVFDTPFDALDIQSRQMLLELITKIHTDFKIPVVLIVNRSAEIPASLTAMGLIRDCSIVRLDSKESIEQDPDAALLLGHQDENALELPAAPKRFALDRVRSGPLVEIHDLNISYRRSVFSHFDFTVNPGEHWLIVGPNGAGKSTLLSVISGDNPLVYANDVTVCGYKRGSGESVWEVKKCLGVVSGALHLDYRVSAAALKVVLSGYYDSIGLYTKAGDDELDCARCWLKIAGLQDLEDKPFRELSFGQQRLLLIIRALVKEPPLLILDEPLQGLDGYARALVRSFVSRIIEGGRSSVLFVSHHPEDVPAGFTHRLSFIPAGDGFITRQERL